MIAPSYLAALVSIIVGGQSIVGLNFASEQWTAFIVVACGLVVAFRQLWAGRSNWFGGKPR